MTGQFLFDVLFAITLTVSIFLVWSIVLRKKGDMSYLESLAGGFVLLVSQIILTELFLGLVIRRLYPLELVVINLAVIICVIRFFRISSVDFKIWFADICRVVSLTKGELFSKKGVLSLIIFLLGSVAVVNSLTLIALYPPTAEDDYHYHLSFVEDIIQTGEIRDFPATHSYTTSYPHNKELVDLWTVIFVRDDTFVEITSLVILAWVGLVIYLQSRRFGAERRWAMVAAILPLFIPVIILLVKTTKVDIFWSSLYLCAIYFLLRIDLRRDSMGRITASFLVCSLVLGIILGSKSSGLVVIASFLFTAGVFWGSQLIKSRSRVKWSHFVKPLVLFAVMLLVTSGLFGLFWYIRSWVVWGNPLYPLSVSFLGISFPGEWSDLSLIGYSPDFPEQALLPRLLNVWKEKEAWYGTFYLADSKNSGFGPLWYIILFPSVLFSCVYALLKKNMTYLFFLLGFLVLFLCMPGNVLPNYTIFLIFVGSIAFSILKSQIVSKWLSKAVISLLLICLCAGSLLLTLDGVYFPVEQTLARFGRDSDAHEMLSLRFQESNTLINRTMKDGGVVIVGNRVWFPYALVARGYTNDVNRVPFLDEQQWIAEVEMVSPHYVMVLKGNSEYDAVRNNPELFELIIAEQDGIHELYAYLKNEYISSYSEREVFREVYVADEQASVSLEEIQVREYLGVFLIDVDYSSRQGLGEELVNISIVREGESNTLSCVPRLVQDDSVSCRANIPQTVSGEVLINLRLYHVDVGSYEFQEYRVMID